MHEWMNDNPPRNLELLNKWKFPSISLFPSDHFWVQFQSTSFFYLSDQWACIMLHWTKVEGEEESWLCSCSVAKGLGLLFSCLGEEACLFGTWAKEILWVEIEGRSLQKGGDIIGGKKQLLWCKEICLDHIPPTSESFWKCLSLAFRSWQKSKALLGSWTSKHRFCPQGLGSIQSSGRK